MRRTNRPEVLAHLDGIIPRFAKKTLAGALAGNPNDAAILVCLPGNDLSGVVLRALWQLKIPAPALRAAVDAAWNCSSYEAFYTIEEHNLLRLFRAAKFPTDHLPRRFVIWRGVHLDKADEERSARNWSWTMRRDVACWFAHPFLNYGCPRVYRRVVNRQQVLAHITRSNEEEIVVYPADDVELDPGNDWLEAAERCRAEKDG